MNLEDILIQKDDFVPKNEAKLTKDVGIIEKPVISIMSSEIQSLEELDQQVDDSYTKDSGMYSCRHCEKTFKKKDHVREHVEIHFEGLSFACSLCDATLRSRKALRLHRYKHLQ